MSKDKGNEGEADARIVQVETVKELRRTIRDALLAHVRPLIWGGPGLGKSAALSQLAQDLARESELENAKTWVLIGSMCDPTDIVGFPVVNGEETVGNKKVPVLRFAPREFAAKLNQDGGTLFLDELTCCAPSVQASLLRVINDLACGDVDLDPDKVMVIAAANPPDMAVNGQELAPPMANRLCHVRYPTGPAAAREWAAEYPRYWEARIPPVRFGRREVSEAHHAKARAIVSGFVHAHTDRWYEYPKDPSQRALAWPSPRQWAAVGRVLSVILHDGRPPYDVIKLAAGLVGPGAAHVFGEFLRTADFPNPDDVLDNPTKYQPTGRPDVDFAVLQSVVGAAQARGTVAAATAAAAVLERAVPGGKGLEASTPAANRLRAVVETLSEKGVVTGVHLVPIARALAPYREARDRLEELVSKYQKKGGK